MDSTDALEAWFVSESHALILRFRRQSHDVSERALLDLEQRALAQTSDGWMRTEFSRRIRQLRQTLVLTTNQSVDYHEIILDDFTKLGFSSPFNRLEIAVCFAHHCIRENQPKRALSYLAAAFDGVDWNDIDEPDRESTKAEYVKLLATLSGT